MYDIRSQKWDPELLQVFGVPEPMMPRVMPSSGVFGTTVPVGPLPGGVPVAGIAGDQQAALFGQGCWQPGSVKNTYGTGCFVVLNTGAELRRSDLRSAYHRLLRRRWPPGVLPSRARSSPPAPPCSGCATKWV